MFEVFLLQTFFLPLRLGNEGTTSGISDTSDYQLYNESVGDKRVGFNC